MAAHGSGLSFGAMFNTIVVGVDGRRGGREALWLARRLGGAGRGAVVAVHVHPRSPEPTARADARRLVATELSLAGVEARTRVTADSSPARGLHRIADTLRADLTVVGSPHRGPIGRALAGDTARATLLGSRRPVAVVVAAGTHARPSDTPVVGLGIDGSAESDAALAFARRAADALHGTVRVLCAAEPPVAFTGGVTYGAEWASLAPAREALAERQLDAAMAELDATATGEIVVGLARDALRRLSGDIDLLVLGSRGFGPVRRTLLGSTSDHLVHDAACSVVVVPRPVGAAPSARVRRAAAGATGP